MQLETMVAMAAPITSYPSGRSTNMKTGSRIMFMTPPRDTPMLASFEAPSDRTRWAKSGFMTVGMPPMTHVQNM